MGNKFEVWVYVGHPSTEYHYEREWSGERLLPALWAMRRAKRRGIGCARLEWRG